MDPYVRQSLLEKQFKTIAENICKLHVTDPIVKLDEFSGIFEIDPKSHLYARLLLQGTYEPEVATLLERFVPKNRDVIDVGANIGFISVKCAKLLESGRVLSVEPTPNALRRLRANLNRNVVENRTIVFEGVAGSSEGTVEINYIPGREEYSTIGTLVHPSVKGEKTSILKVESARLDSLVGRHALNPGFLKIDVEGMEHIVLSGARELLCKYKPIVLCEICDPLLRANSSSSIEIIKTIRSHGYDLFDSDDPSRMPGEVSYGNIICFPKEMNVTREFLIESIL